MFKVGNDNGEETNNAVSVLDGDLGVYWGGQFRWYMMN